MQGFLLGLANGTTCVAYCVPSLVPYLLGEGKNIRQNAITLGQFLTGRLLGYLIFAMLAWITSRYINTLSSSRDLFLGFTYIALSLLLLFYGLANTTMPCAGQSLGSLASKAAQKYPSLMPLTMGFLTGLNLCPPFLLTFASATEVQTVSQSLLFFFSFFLGTALYFLPVPLLGAFNTFLPLKTIGKMTAVLMSIYYLYTGIIMFLGGINT